MDHTVDTAQVLGTLLIDQVTLINQVTLIVQVIQIDLVTLTDQVMEAIRRVDPGPHPLVMEDTKRIFVLKTKCVLLR